MNIYSAHDEAMLAAPKVIEFSCIRRLRIQPRDFIALVVCKEAVDTSNNRNCGQDC
jgi:hypothetical protein